MVGETRHIPTVILVITKDQVRDTDIEAYWSSEGPERAPPDWGVQGGLQGGEELTGKEGTPFHRQRPGCGDKPGGFQRQVWIEESFCASKLRSARELGQWWGGDLEYPLENQDSVWPVSSQAADGVQRARIIESQAWSSNPSVFVTR